MNLISFHNIIKSYPLGKERYTALHEISFEIREGELIAVTGASGSGKTTLLNLLGLLDTYDAGEYFFQNENVGKLSDRRKAELRNRSIGFVFQEYELLNNETALYNVSLPMYFSKTKVSRIRKTAEEMLRKVGLPETHFKKQVKCMSGGERQRVAIARALANDPQIILADEPTGSLDSQSADAVAEILIKLNEMGKTVVIVTHNPTLAAKCRRQIVMKDGRLISECTAF